MFDRRTSPPALAAALCVALAGPGDAQEPLSLDHFDGSESWPLIRPSTAALRPFQYRELRIAFDGEFPGPGGFGVPPLEPLPMLMDLLNVSFRGRPALLVQWISTPPPRREREAPGLDVLVVDHASFRLQYRIALSARPDVWGGRYEVVQAHPDRVVQTTVPDTGGATTTVVPRADLFDFASYQFLFPRLDLRAGLAVRLAGYEYLDKAEEVLAVHVVGRTQVRDAAGRSHQVWQVDVLPPHRAVLITFWVTAEPPYFYGWQYRLTRNGATAMRLTLRDWTPTGIGGRESR